MSEYTKEEIEELKSYLDTTGAKYDEMCDQIKTDIYSRQTQKKDAILDIFETKAKLIELDDQLQEKLQKRMLSALNDVHEFDMKVKRDTASMVPTDIPTALDYLI